MFRPCIDIKDKKVVQLEQGERLALTDQRSPEELAKIYADDALNGGHMIDLQGGPNKEVILPALKFHNLQVGGGIRLDNGRDYLDAGATHLIFSSAVFKSQGVDWEMIKKINEVYGKKHIVLAPDVRDDRFICVNQWKTTTKIELTPKLLNQLETYCDELLIHSIEKEGMEGGTDLSLTTFLEQHKKGSIVYAGGACDLKTVENLHHKGIDVTIGKAYFSGLISHDDLVELNQRLSSEQK